MEYVAGETLKDYIARMGKLSNDMTVRIAIEIGEALEQAHANGIIHCDIKPHNILVTEQRPVQGRRFQDRAGDEQRDGSRQQGIGAFGSVHYFSPEQAVEAKEEYAADGYLFARGSYCMKYYDWAYSL